MKIKKTILIILIVLMAGCQAFRNEKERTLSQREDFLVGTEGLYVDFSEGMLESIRENSVFNIIFEIENKGAYDIREGVYAVDVEDQYIELKDQPVQRFALKGRTLTIPLGDKSLINLKAKSRAILGEKEDASIVVSSCYRYKTQASIDVCIDTDIEKRKTQKVCEVSSVSFSGGQGGPVAVTNVEPKMLPSDRENLIIPYFEITIENYGDGFVIDSSKAQDLCIGRRLGEVDFNNIKVQAQLADQILRCESLPNEYESEMKVVCTLDEGIRTIRGTYTTFLKVELDYGYIQKIEREIEITK